VSGRRAPLAEVDPSAPGMVWLFFVCFALLCFALVWFSKPVGSDANKLVLGNCNPCFFFVKD
jgi:hypothetical protein